MNFKSKIRDEERELIRYDDVDSSSLNHVSTVNIPYEMSETEPSDKFIQKKIDRLPEEIRSKIKGYQLEKEATKLSRTKIAKLFLYE